eukprot:TRINITY_DN89350_c0_g1_i1.p1 TRINITY_DN89350_c0_g1~~TRINITY_DN89350_c0_g1_i1.p1  ORF type:complete len:179 (-),score=29.14 TRINITY_DN89350_c0_g1_i1:254-790(-)
MGTCREKSALLLLQVRSKVNSASNHREHLLSSGAPMVDTELIVLLSLCGMFVFGLLLLLVFWSAKGLQDKWEAGTAWPAARFISPCRDHHDPRSKDAWGQTPVVNMEQAPPATMPLAPHLDQPHGPPTLAQLPATNMQFGPVLGPMLLNGRSQAKQACSAADPMRTQYRQLGQACRPC